MKYQKKLSASSLIAGISSVFVPNSSNSSFAIVDDKENQQILSLASF